jgi:hypothetical protein
MNTTITIGGLLCALGIIAGIGLTGIGALAIFAGGMSDSPQAGADASKQGCIIAGVGLVLLVGSIVGLVW